MKSQTGILAAIIIILQVTVSISQNLPPDTIFVKRSVAGNELRKGTFEIDTLLIPRGRNLRHVLVGTTFLPSSDRIIRLLNRGLSPISLEIIEECDNSSAPPVSKDYPQFKKISRDSNTLSIDVAIEANCCHDFLGEAEVVGKNTLNLVYTSYGEFCACNCCFTLRYKFDTTMEKEYQILEYVTINGRKVSGKVPDKK